MHGHNTYMCVYMYTYTHKNRERTSLHYLWILCEFTYSLKLICNLKINTPGTFTVIHRHMQKGEKIWVTFSAELEHRDARPSRFGFHTVSN